MFRCPQLGAATLGIISLDLSAIAMADPISWAFILLEGYQGKPRAAFLFSFGPLV